MNKNLKVAFFCATSQHRWGKGLTLDAALKAAGITSLKKKNVDFYVMLAVFDNPSQEELENLCMCISSNSIDGHPQYYQDERTQEDTDMITKYHVGWVTIYKTKGVS